MKIIKMQTYISKIFSEHKLASVVLAGIVIRILLIPIAAHPYDVYAWYTLSIDSLKNPTFNIYNFPPLWYSYTMIPIAYVYDFLAKFLPTGTIPMASLPQSLNFYPSMGIDYVPGMLFNTVVKFPFLLSDIVIALLLYQVVKESTMNKGLAEKAAFLWFLNPFVIWISAGWGMWDTMPALFSLTSFYLVLKKRLSFSAISLALGVASKLYPALFIVPTAIYIVKSNSFDEKRKSCLKFLAAFFASSAVLFLPYFGLATGFLSGYFVATPSSSGADPIANPVGFGLTYWSVCLLGRFLDFAVNAELITIASVGSVVLVAVCMVIVYWRISKTTFANQTFDLGSTMVLPVLVLFLSYRIIPEQWFVWALPFLVILCVGGQVEGAFYWIASFIGLLYAVLNCPFPFFFLPLAPWHANTLLGMVQAFWEIDVQRILLLTTLGLVFSILVILVLLRLARFRRLTSDKLAGNPE